MRVTRWLPAVLALLLLATLGAAWVLPDRLDSERFRGPLQRLASHLLGAPVRIAGPIRLVLLPRPVLEAGSLAIEQAGGDRTAPSLTAAGVRLRLALRPLLAGQIQAQSLLLYRPCLRLPGRFDPRLLLLRHPGWIGGAATRIEAGRIEAGGLVLSGIEAHIAAAPLTGDLTATGEAHLADGASWAFTLRLIQPGGDGAAGLALSLAGQGAWHDTAVQFSGQLAADGAIQGHGSTHGPDLARLLPAPHLPFSAEGRVSIADGLAEADDLALQLGDAPARGAVALRLAPALRLDLALAASRLDLDPWLALLGRRDAGRAGDDAIPMGIDLSAEAGTLAGGTVRGLRAAFDLDAGEVRVRELRASLPGDATLRLTGTARNAGFSGDATLASPNWAQTEVWLAALLPAGLPRLPLTRLDLSTHILVDAGGVSLGSLSGALDGGGVSGALAWRAPAGGQPARLAAGLDLRRVRLDRFVDARWPRLDVDLRIAARHAVWRGLDLATLRLDLLGQGGALELRRLQATTDRLSVTASGLLSAAGRLDDGSLTLDTPRLDALRSIPELPFLALASMPLPAASPLLQAPLHLALQGSGPREAISATLQATLGDASIEAQPLLDLQTGQWRGAVSLRHPSARRLLEASLLLPQAGLPADADWLGEGSFALTARCAGTPTTLAADDLALGAGRLHLTGALSGSWAGGGAWSGRIDAAALPLPPWSGLADFWLSGAAPRGQANLAVRAAQVTSGGQTVFSGLAADVTLANGRLLVTALQAGIAGGILHGEAALDLAASPPRLSAQVAVVGAVIAGGLTGLPVDVAAGSVTGRGSLTAAGHSGAAMLASLRGLVEVQIAAGALHGVALADLPPDLPAGSVNAALSGGTTAFDRATMTLRLDQGIATVRDGRATLPSGALAISGSYDLAQDAADLALTFRPAVPTPPLDPHLPPPTIGLRLLGPRGGVQRIAELAPLARWRTARDQP